MQPSARTGYILAVITAFVWAATSPGVSFLLTTYQIPPLVVAFWRDAIIAIGCIGGMLVATLLGKMPRISRADLRGFAITGIISIGIYHALFIGSIALNGAAMAIVLIYLYPVVVSLGAWIFFKEPISPTQIVALILAVLGCALLVRAYDPNILRLNWLGILVGIASAFTHAGYVLFSQRSVGRHSPWISLAFTMIFGAITLLVLTTLALGPQSLLQVSTAAAPIAPWLTLAAVALGPTFIGYILFTMSLRHIPGRIASLIVVIEAPIATLAAVLLLNEQIEGLQSVGIGLIILAAVLPGIAWRPATLRSTEQSA